MYQRPLQLCVLFGSQASEQVHLHSDVALAIWPNDAPAPEQKLTWIGDLQSQPDNDVSLVVVSPDLDPVLGMEIVRHGIVVNEAAPEIWFERRLDLWHTYQGILPAELGDRLAQAAAMRNILVHLYERIDYTILHGSIQPTVQDFGESITTLSNQYKQ